MREKILFYRTTEPYGAFSNFSKHPIELDNRTWPTTEHYFQAQKFLGTDDEWLNKIATASSARVAADMGRDRDKLLRSDWEEVKEKVMLKALRAKFTQYEGLKALLLDTEGAELVEHTRNDSYWADGGDGSGKNRLGVLLMILRDILRTEDYTPPTSKDLTISFFKPFTNLVLSDGGDGGGTIITRYTPAELVADWYEEWQSNKKFKLERRNRDDGTVSFWDNQEGFVIVNASSKEETDNTKVRDLIAQDFHFGNYLLMI